LRAIFAPPKGVTLDHELARMNTDLFFDPRESMTIRGRFVLL
jgi:hypothetical protein